MVGPEVLEDSWTTPVEKLCKRTVCIARAALPVELGAVQFATRALPCVGYVAQLLVPLRKVLVKEMWVANKITHAPAASFSVSDARELAARRLVDLPSTSAFCLASLLRTAISGKMNYIPWVELLQVENEVNVEEARTRRGLYWGKHWRQQPIVFTLWHAAHGKVDGGRWNEQKLRAAIEAGLSAGQHFRTLSEWMGAVDAAMDQLHLARSWECLSQWHRRRDWEGQTLFLAPSAVCGQISYPRLSLATTRAGEVPPHVTQHRRPTSSMPWLAANEKQSR